MKLQLQRQIIRITLKYSVEEIFMLICTNNQFEQDSLFFKQYHTSLVLVKSSFLQIYSLILHIESQDFNKLFDDCRQYFMKSFTVIKPQVKIFSTNKIHTSTAQTAWNINMPLQIQKEAIPQPKINVYRPHIIQKKSPKKSQQIHILQPAKITSKGFRIGSRKSELKSQIQKNSELSFSQHQQNLQKIKEPLLHDKEQQKKIKDFQINNKEDVIPIKEPKVQQIVIIKDQQSEEMLKNKIAKSRRSLQIQLKKSLEQYRAKAQIQQAQEVLGPEQAKAKHKRKLVIQKIAQPKHQLQLQILSQQISQQMIKRHRRLLNIHQRHIPLNNQLIQLKIQLALLQQSYDGVKSKNLSRALSPSFQHKNIKAQNVLINQISQNIQQKIKMRTSRKIQKDREAEPVFLSQKELNIIVEQQVQNLPSDKKNMLKRRLLLDYIYQSKQKQNLQDKLSQIKINKIQPFIVNLDQGQQLIHQAQKISSKRSLSWDKNNKSPLFKDNFAHSHPLDINLDDSKQQQLMSQSQRLSFKRQLNNKNKIQVIPVNINLDDSKQQQLMSQSQRLSFKRYLNNSNKTQVAPLHLNLDGSVEEQSINNNNPKISSKRIYSNQKPEQILLKDSLIPEASIKVSLNSLTELNEQKNQFHLKRQLVFDQISDKDLFKSEKDKHNAVYININNEVQTINLKQKQTIPRKLQISWKKFSRLQKNQTFIPPPLKNFTKSRARQKQEQNNSNQKRLHRFKHFVNLPRQYNSSNSPKKSKSPLKITHINSLVIGKQK